MTTSRAAERLNGSSSAFESVTAPSTKRGPARGLADRHGHGVEREPCTAAEADVARCIRGPGADLERQPVILLLAHGRGGVGPEHLRTDAAESGEIERLIFLHGCSSIERREERFAAGGAYTSRRCSQERQRPASRRAHTGTAGQECDTSCQGDTWRP